MHISKSIRWDKIVLVEASTLCTDFVCLSVSQTCAKYLANSDLQVCMYVHTVHSRYLLYEFKLLAGMMPKAKDLERN